MIIQRIEITKFRGFENVSFDLGTHLTVIAGQNGTQKTTVLGLLTQPFTITDAENPMKNARPLSGGTFKSAFSEKFKLSERFDPAKSHEWTLFLPDKSPFTLQSMKRGKSEGVRFWKKGTRGKGTGYIQLPVIFLSLKRLMPIGEDEQLNESNIESLTPDEIDFFKTWHNKILISNDDIDEAQYLASPNKNTLGINTKLYDWRLNSAGQDNVGKILLAVLSFQRLKKRYSNYSGGILAIDELDATLYPGSQIILFAALRTFASKLNLQIIFTTHSLSLLEKACYIQEQNQKITAARNQIKVVFLEKINNQVKILQDISYRSIIHKLNVTVGDEKVKKIIAFTEDRECEIFVKAILKSKGSKLDFVKCTMGCSSLIDLGVRGIPSFSFPEGIIFLDGDVRVNPATLAKIQKLKNFLVLPGKISPERLLANYLYNLTDDSPVWKVINPHFTRQYCFKEYSLREIDKDRDKAKAWFNLHLKYWGNNASKVINPWIKENPKETEDFVKAFKKTYNKFAIHLGLEKFDD